MSLTFDDGQATQHAVKAPLAARGMHATFYLNSAKVGTSSFYMTWAQATALAADGNDIGGHTLTHANLTALSDAQARAEICDDRQNLIGRGFNPQSFAYPYGASDAATQAIVRDCGYLSGRRVGGIVSPNWCLECGSPRAESMPAENPFDLRTPSFGSGELTLSALQGVITQAELSGGGWVPLVFHGVCESATCGEGWVKPGTFEALLDWLEPRVAHGTVVRTVRDVMETPLSDTTAPETAIDSGPNGTVASTAASFGFSSLEAGVDFECGLDGGGWADCTSPKAYSGLEQGSHTFSVRAVDAAGNADASAAMRSWTVDTVAPDTSISTGPSGIVNSTFTTFEFSSPESGVTLECRLDSGGWAGCASPKSYSGLAEGAHTVSVRAVDVAGNADTSPATRSWTVDTVAPDTSITTGPSGTLATGAATFDFSATEAGSFECRLDGGAWSVCEPPRDYLSLGDGTHTFSVRAVDAVGHVDPTPAERTWTVEEPPPPPAPDPEPIQELPSPIVEESPLPPAKEREDTDTGEPPPAASDEPLPVASEEPLPVASEEPPAEPAEDDATTPAGDEDAVARYLDRVLRATARHNKGRRLKRLLRTGSLRVRLPGTEEVRGTLRIQVSILPDSGGRAIRLARLRTRAPIGSRTERVKLSKRGKRRLARLWVAALELNATLVPDEGDAVHDRRVFQVRR